MKQYFSSLLRHCGGGSGISNPETLRQQSTTTHIFCISTGKQATMAENVHMGEMKFSIPDDET